MVYYINDLELANTNVLKRTSADAWSVVSKSAENIPYIGQTGQKPTQFNLNMDLIGDGRFDMLTSIRAEIYNCNSIFIKSTNTNLYGNQTGVWLAHSSFNEKESGSKQLSVQLSGMIDPYQFHSCDFDLDTDWIVHFNLASVAPDTTTKYSGNAAIKGYKTSPGSEITYGMRYQPSTNFDLTNYSTLILWFRFSTTALVTGGVRGLCLYSSAMKYSSWEMPTFAANKWTCMEIDLASPHYESSGGVDMASIDSLSLMVETTDAPPTTLSIWLDDIRYY